MATPSLTYAASRTTSSGTTFTPTLPSGTGRVFVPVSCPSDTTLTTASADWQKGRVETNGSGQQVTWFVSKLSAGTSPGSLTVTSAASTLFSTTAIRSDILRTRMVFGTATKGTGTNANPGLVDQLKSQASKFLTVLTLNGTGSPSGVPSGYTSRATQAGATSGAGTFVADKTATASSDDPGAWANSSVAYIAQSIILVDAGASWDEDWVSAVQNIVANGVNVPVNFLGDSLTGGMTHATTGASANQRATARPAVWAAGLTAGPGSSRNFLGVGGANVTSGQLNAYDNRLTPGTNWDHSRGLGYNTLGGGYLTCSSGTASLAFVPGGTPNRRRVLKATYPGSPNYTHRWDGGSATSLTMNAANGISWDAAVAGTGTTINIASTGATGFILAVETWTDGSPQVSVFNGGWFGCTSTQMAALDFWGPVYASAALAAKLTVINCVSNDPTSGVSTQQSVANLQLLSLVGLLTGSTVLETPPYASGGTEAAQDALFDVVEALADILCVGFFRISAETGWTSYATASSNGFMTSGDNHCTTAGYADWAARELAYMDPGPLSGADVEVPAGSITTAGAAPGIATGKAVAVPAGALALAGLAPSIGTGAVVSVPASDVAITASAPIIATGASVSVPANDNALAALAPTIQTGAAVEPPAGVVALAGAAPEIGTAAVVSVPATDVALAGLEPTITATSGVTLWTPTELGSAVVAWWDADDVATLTLSGSAVTDWASKAGGITASQGTSSARPSYSATARNGKPGVVFDGGDRLAISSVAGFPTGSGASALAIVGQATNTSGVNSIAFSWGSGLTNSRVVGYNNTGNRIWTSWLAAGEFSLAEDWPTSDRIITVQYASTGVVTATVDGGSTQTSTLSTPATSAVSGNIGSFPGIGSFTGPLQEIVLANRVLTTDERQQLEGYLAWKWGLEASLPSGHPYESAAPTVASAVVIEPPTGAVVLAAHAPTISVSASVSVPVASIAVAGLAPAIAAGSSVAVPAVNIEVQGLTPTVGAAAVVEPPAGGVTLTAYPPTVSVGAAVEVPTASCSLAGNAPALALGETVDVPASPILIVGLSPEIITWRGIVHVPASDLTLAGHAPTLEVGTPSPLRRIVLTGAVNSNLAVPGLLIRKVS